jgi:hypothetical protein
VVYPINTPAFERRCIHAGRVPLPATYSASTPQSRALPARRIDTLGAHRIYGTVHQLSVRHCIYGTGHLGSEIAGYLNRTEKYSRRVALTAP